MDASIHWSREDFFEAIISSSNDAIITKNLSGFISSWNKSAETIFGFTADEMVGQHITRLIPPERIAEEDNILEQIRDGQRLEHFETVRLTKSGRRLHVSLTISPIRNHKGEIVGASKIARNITSRKEAEEQQKRYTINLELINKVSKAILSQTTEIDILQKITDLSTELTGAGFGAFFYNKTDAKGKSYMLYSLSGVPRSAFEKFPMPRNTPLFSRTFNGEGLYRSDDITQDPLYGKNPPHHGKPAGHLPVISYLAVPVISPSGHVIGGLFFGHAEKGVFKKEHEPLVEAVASLSALALEKTKMYEDLQQYSQKQDQFIAFTSHELKTPLTSLSSYVELLAQNESRVESVLPHLRKQVDNLKSLLASLLDLTKIQAGVLALEYKTCSLLSLINDAIFSIKPVYPTNRFVLSTPFEDLSVKIDPNKMLQVLTNLLSNASKYSPPGSTVTLTAAVIGDDVLIEVSDEGKGIPEEDLEKIFDLFFRVRRGQEQPDGLGLGLYICKQIIAAHRGNISASSTPNLRSTFRIEFPVNAE